MAVSQAAGFRTVQVGPQPTQLASFLAASGSVMIVNNDTVNSIWVGADKSVAANSSSAIAIPGLGSITFTPQDLWAVSAGPTVSVLLVPSGTQWAPSPAQVAAQISALGLATLAQQVTQQTTIPNNIAVAGVPLLNASVRLLNTVNQSILTGATYAPASVGLIKPTCEVLISLQNGAADTTPFVTLTMQWSDSASGLVLEPDTYQFACGTVAANPVVIHGILVAHGDTLTITVKNNGSTTCTLNLLVLNNSKPTNVDTELWRYLNNSQNINTFDVFGAFDVPTNYIMQVNTSVGIGVSISRTLPIYIGAPIQLAAHSSSAAADLRLTVNVCGVIGAALGYTDRGIYYNTSNSNGDIAPVQLWLPRAQCSVTATNNNAAIKTVTIDVVGTT